MAMRGHIIVVSVAADFAGTVFKIVTKRVYGVVRVGHAALTGMGRKSRLSAGGSFNGFHI